MLTIGMGLVVVAIIATIGWKLWSDSALSRAAFGWDFIWPGTETIWNPVKDNYRAWPMIYGTLVTSIFSMLLAVPISLLAAIFLAEICPMWLRMPLGWLIELLAAIPSVVYGLWGIFVFLPLVVAPFGIWLGDLLGGLPGVGVFFAGPMPDSGASRLAATLVLTLMIIPTITAVSRDVLLAIPPAQREAAMALGSTHWETIWCVLIPYGLSGIIGAVILGMGRAMGETMAVTMVIGNNLNNTLSLLHPSYSMASVIANQFAEATSPLHLQALIEVGLVLFVITFALNIFARLLVWQVARRNPREGR